MNFMNDEFQEQVITRSEGHGALQDRNYALIYKMCGSGSSRRSCVDE